nr:retrovirus-related Pol polyprotein from transposon TNT 1-94 [Tanacetum cinerariifolium]
MVKRTVNVTGARENVGSPVLKQSRIQCFNIKEFGHFAKECRKPKRVKDFAYHKEKTLLCKQAEQGVSLQVEQYDWLAETDEEIDEHELEAHYSYMAKIQEKSESVSNICLVETDDSNVIPDSPDMSDDNIQNDQNDVESDDERVALTNLIANLKLDVDENKKIQKQLKKSNTTLAQELKECKAILVETNALDELQCLYLHKVKECDCLAQKLSTQTESVSKEVHTELLQCFAKVEKHSISLEIALQKRKEQVKHDTVWNEKASNVFRKEREQYIEIQDLKAQLQDKNMAIRVNHKPNVSRPRHKSNQLKNKVVPNNSQVKLKKTQVEVHPRIPSVSNKMKSVTTCKDSLNSKTLNANAVCATCKKCLVDSNHFVCVTKMLNDVNARTKKPKVVPISTRKPKSQANKSVATPHKNKVASKSTNQKPQSYFRMLYEKTRNVMINRVYNIEGLNHNLFLVGQFCDADLEVAFRKSTCFVRDLQSNDLLTGNRGSDLYTIYLQESTSSTPLCLMAKASPTQAWLWHRRLFHLNFNYINLLSKKDIMIGLPS